MPDAHYELPELAALYDIESGWGEDREFYLALAGADPQTILEIGCGTGLIARAMAAKGHDVTGIDPARAMLDVGKQAQNGDRVQWQQGFAQDFQLDQRFDLAFMTGHAFQVLLEEEDILSTFANIRRHLKPGGIFAFESRNPALPWQEIFEHSATLNAPFGQIPVEWRVAWRRGDMIRFKTHYQLPDGERVSDSLLRFLPVERIADLLRRERLEIQSIYGDWNSAPFDPETSREIIVIARRPV